MRMTEQTGYVLETETVTVAEVFLPVAENKNGYGIGSSSALLTVVTVVYTLLSPHVFSTVDSWVLQIYKK